MNNVKLKNGWSICLFDNSAIELIHEKDVEKMKIQLSEIINDFGLNFRENDVVWLTIGSYYIESIDFDYNEKSILICLKETY